MINFLISLVLFAVSIFLLVIFIRNGLKGAEKLDYYFLQKNHSNYPGFWWYFRIPFSVGVIPEYFFAIVLGYENYFKKNWWALKTASFISVLVFAVGIKHRATLTDYFSFSFLKEDGFSSLYTSGNKIILINIAVLFFVILFIFICIESIKMQGFYALLRIIIYSFLSFLMVNLTLIALSLIILVTVVYLFFKLIGLFFFSSNKHKDTDNSEETAGSILKGGFKDFKKDLYEWEMEEKNIRTNNKRTEEDNKGKLKRPRITHRIRTVQKENKIPRIYPD